MDSLIFHFIDIFTVDKVLFSHVLMKEPIIFLSILINAGMNRWVYRKVLYF